MTITVGNLINVFIIAIGIGICALNIFTVSTGAKLRKEVTRYFQVFFSVIILYIASHLLRQVLDGIPGAGIHTTLYVVTFIEFLASAFMAYLISALILAIANPQNIKRYQYYLLVILIINTILLIAAQFTKMFYYFDDSNVYHRSSLYIISNFAHIAMMLLDIYLLIRFRKCFSKSVARALWFYIIAPLVAIGIQSVVQDVQFIIIATVAGAFYMFAVIMRDLTQKFEAEKAERGRMETELNMASAIQADMLPNIFPAFPEKEEFDVYASMNPAKEVGGDFYDFFLLDDTHLGLVMADVSGKGVPAALFMMISKILVQNYALIKKDTCEALEAVNHQICANNREEMFVTMWLGILDLETGELTASNAGHEFPALKQTDGRFELVRDKHGLVIGGMDGVRYKEYTLQLQSGAKLFLYTDGVPEATNASQELFGTERMIEALRTAEDKTPKEILEAVSTTVSEFVGDAPQFDDLTMMCIEYKGK